MAYTIKHGQTVPLADLVQIAKSHQKMSLDMDTRARVIASRDKLESMVSNDRVIYGVNTSVGGFVRYLVPLEKASMLQENLLNAVATNVGEYLSETVVRAIMVSRIVSLSRGNSAISLENLDKLIAVYNAGIVPCVPEKGSLGTSGDLGPLASIALVCLGQWKAKYQGEIIEGSDALGMAGIEPMKLSFKEGLAMINGTSGMVGLGSLVYAEAKQLLDQYITVSAMSFEGLAGKNKPFDPRVHQLKPHPGQLEVATKLWQTLSDSTLIVNEHDTEKRLAKEMDGSVKPGTSQIEDAYSIRCTPQILGPVVDSLKNIETTLTNELNSSNDNPLVLPEENEVFHNGHFHGQYVAMAMDHLVIAMTTLTNLSNRRIDRFLDSSNNDCLPKFLCQGNAGQRLGLMGGQFMTASITAENRSLSMPVSIQSLTSTGDFQDIVSFGFVAARRAREVVNNTKYVISFELMCACQAVDIRGIEGLSTKTKQLYQATRKHVPFLEKDITISDYIEAIKNEILSSHPKEAR